MDIEKESSMVNCCLFVQASHSVTNNIGGPVSGNAIYRQQRQPRRNLESLHSQFQQEMVLANSYKNSEK